MQKKVVTMLMTLTVLCFLFTITAFAEDIHIKIVLKAQGGSGGTSEIYVDVGSTLPEITIPSRRGYTFLGYYSSDSSEQYYDKDGQAVRNNTFTDTAALYAHWQVCVYNITYANMDGAIVGENHPEQHAFGVRTAISDPTKEGYTFFGWKVNNSMIASKGLELDGTFYTEDITLTAVWNKAHLVTVVNNTTNSVNVPTKDLQEIFQRQVDNPLNGVTADDLNTSKVELTMTVSDKDNQAEGAADILGITQGEALSFYDFSVTKSVICNEGDSETITSMNELPNTVTVEITLPSELANRTGYRIYRYHNQQAQAIPVGPVEDDLNQTVEYYTVGTNTDNNTVLTIHTRRLSTYAVIGNANALEGTAEDVPAQFPMDVQGRILVSEEGAVYSSAIKWGEMHFVYSTGKEWDPYEHRYTDVRFFDWVGDYCYSKGNNEVTVYNHSNADVEVSYGVDNTNLPGVDMTMNTKNTASSERAERLFLSKVPYEGAEEPSVSGFLRLNGSPTDPEFNINLDQDSQGYVDVGNISVTISWLGGSLTPKSAVN